MNWRHVFNVISVIYVFFHPHILHDAIIANVAYMWRQRAAAGIRQRCEHWGKHTAVMIVALRMTLMSEEYMFTNMPIYSKMHQTAATVQMKICIWKGFSAYKQKPHENHSAYVAGKCNRMSTCNDTVSDKQIYITLVGFNVIFTTL